MTPGQLLSTLLGGVGSLVSAIGTNLGSLIDGVLGNQPPNETPANTLNRRSSVIQINLMQRSASL